MMKAPDLAVLEALNDYIPRKRGLRRLLWKMLLPEPTRSALEESSATAGQRRPRITSRHLTELAAAHMFRMSPEAELTDSQKETARERLVITRPWGIMID